MYIIKDWVGNTMNWGEFDTFEDARGEAYSRVESEIIEDGLNPECDETFSEYFVVEE